MEEMIKKLANTIVNYSLNVKENEKVLITYQSTECNYLIKQLIEEINKRKGIVFINYIDPILNNVLKENTKTERIELIKEYGQFELNHFDSFINIKYNSNDYESSKIPDDIRKEINDIWYS